MFTYQTKIHMQEIDAAGVMFYAHLFTLIHDAYEEFMTVHNLSLRDILEKKDYILPIVHSEADYKKPIRLGDILEIQLEANEFGAHSFDTQYTIVNQEKVLVALAKTVHVVISKQTHSPLPLPSEIKKIFAVK